MLLMQRLEPLDVLGMVLVDEFVIGPCARHRRLWRRNRFANQHIDRDFVRQRREIWMDSCIITTGTQQNRVDRFAIDT